MDKYAYMRQAAARVAKVTVLLGDAEFRRLDAFCRNQGFKKSTLLARLTREHLDAEGFVLQEELPFVVPALESGQPGFSREG